MTPRRRSLIPAAVGIALLAATTACDDSNSYGSYYSAGVPDGGQIRLVAQQTNPANRPPVHAVEAFDIGPMLVDDQGFSLYRYDRDDAGTSTSNCTGACAEVWQPMPASREPLGTLLQGRLGSFTRPDGSDQLTLAGWPLYRYTKDEVPGETTGQGVDDAWFPIRPSGGKIEEDAQLESVDTSTPLSDTDVELLVKVRQAGLWEMPSSNWARTQGENRRVREIGLILLVDHGRLDGMVRTVAGRFGAELPDQPNVKQQDWLNEMRDAGSAAEFDRIYANRLRLAHGKVLTYIANVRAGSRNEAVRAFADTGNSAVLRHINLLESTGLVDFEELPSPVLDASATAAGAALSMEATDVFLALLLAALLCGGTVLALWLVRGSGTRPRKPRTPPMTYP
ncbi:DUF4142 domain-containing protein [Amycolatopsis cihanbeyliensis]|uniref:Putative lipoprotein with Yx(FWY)xxD motif n=1 Tax=Amycolatopsis cihanbeyliensis TaxID=1128664 RepID=A0A542DD27_AMYCI|nr:DUF4142 domain-containing protein [Amycolatopsis cihanbeyliensis]TQJ00977.1 putative lipoprotein with Yx(FWY)xxD motif [Amycolatopsis cihanbeyliensis]